MTHAQDPRMLGVYPSMLACARAALAEGGTNALFRGLQPRVFLQLLICFAKTVDYSNDYACVNNNECYNEYACVMCFDNIVQHRSIQFDTTILLRIGGSIDISGWPYSDIIRSIQADIEGNGGTIQRNSLLECDKQTLLHPLLT
jgi:hypothetical protein